MALRRGSAEGDIDIDLDHEGKATLEYIKNFDKRMDAFRRMFAYAMATDLLEAVKSKIPKDKKYDRLTKALELAEVTTGKTATAFALHIDNKAKKIKKIDVPKTVIYIRPRRLQDKARKDIQILSDYGPWTVDTIPFWPSRKEAVIIQRKVDQKLVDKIAKMQDDQRNKVVRELESAGRKDLDKIMTRRTRVSRKIKAVPDVAFEALTLEFGGGGSRAKPAWRLSMMEIIPTGLKSISSRYRNISQTLFDARFKNWKQWPRVKNKITLSEVKKFAGFQKRLGY